jgi:hypothetical protein
VHLVQHWISFVHILSPKEVSFDVQRDGRRGPYYADYKVALTFSGDIDEADLPKIKKVLDGQCTVQHILLSTNNTVETTYSIG